MRPRRPLDRIVQIAGVIDAAEAALLVRAGVDWLGFPFRLTVHREDLTEDAAARIVRFLPPTCAAVLITYLDRAPAIVELCRQLGARTVQLHGPIAPAELAAPARFGLVGLHLHPSVHRRRAFPHVATVEAGRRKRDERAEGWISPLRYPHPDLLTNLASRSRIGSPDECCCRHEETRGRGTGDD